MSATTHAALQNTASVRGAGRCVVRSHLWPATAHCQAVAEGCRGRLTDKGAPGGGTRPCALRLREAAVTPPPAPAWASASEKTSPPTTCPCGWAVLSSRSRARGGHSLSAAPPETRTYPGHGQTRTQSGLVAASSPKTFQGCFQSPGSMAARAGPCKWLGDGVSSGGAPRPPRHKEETTTPQSARLLASPLTSPTRLSPASHSARPSAQGGPAA